MLTCMSDYRAFLWLQDEQEMERAQGLLADSLAQNDAVVSHVVKEDSDEGVRWLEAAFDWDSEAASRISDDFALDALTDKACLAGLVATLSAAGIVVVEGLDELA